MKNVRDFLEQERALCSQALDGDRDVLLRAAELLHTVFSAPQQEGQHVKP